MCAFVVSHKHINTLLSWANRNQVSTVHLPIGGRIEWSQVEDLQRAAELLLAENERSVATLYKAVSSGGQLLTEEAKIVFQFETARLEPVAIIKACDCYEYQADSAVGYRDGAAALIVAFIRSKAIQMLPGYKQADWEIH